MSRMTKVRAGALQLGSNVVELLLPQRRPMLMVDRVEVFEAGPPPTLHASRHISANEIFFDGHFPGMHLWPGCLTIEGMGQTGVLLVVVLAIRDGMAVAGEDPDRGLDALRNLDLGYRMHPGYRPDDAARFRFYDELLTRLEGTPGLQEAALVSNLPTLGAATLAYHLEGEPEAEAADRPSALRVAMSPSYLALLDVPILAGRYFDDRDGFDGQDSIIVTSDFAARVWPGEPALGKRLRVYSEQSPPTPEIGRASCRERV